MPDESYPHDKDWYLNHDLEDDEPWYWIIDRFLEAKIFAKRLKDKNEIKKLDTIYKKDDEFSAVLALSPENIRNSNFDRSKSIVKVLGSELLFLIEVVQNRIENKEINSEFLMLWGELERVFRSLEIAYSQYVKKRKNSKNTNRLIDAQRVWYAAWLKKGDFKKRVELDAFLENLGQKVLDGSAKTPKDWTEKEFRNFIVRMAKQEETKFQLNESYSPQHLKKKDVERILSKKSELYVVRVFWTQCIKI